MSAPLYPACTDETVPIEDATRCHNCQTVHCSHGYEPGLQNLATYPAPPDLIAVHYPAKRHACPRRPPTTVEVS